MLLVVRKVFVGYVAVLEFCGNGTFGFYQQRVKGVGGFCDLAFKGDNNAFAVGYVVEVYK